MDRNVTLENLILYYYNETELLDSVMIQNAIDNDYLTAESFEELKSAIGCLDEIMISPSEGSVEKILNYSRAMN